MKDIKVLGTGCANCKTTLKLIEETASAKGVAVQLEKIEDMAAILGYGVMSPLGVVTDNHGGDCSGRVHAPPVKATRSATFGRACSHRQLLSRHSERFQEPLQEICD